MSLKRIRGCRLNEERKTWKKNEILFIWIHILNFHLSFLRCKPVCKPLAYCCIFAFEMIKIEVVYKLWKALCGLVSDCVAIVSEGPRRLLKWTRGTRERESFLILRFKICTRAFEIVWNVRNSPFALPFLQMVYPFTISSTTTVSEMSLFKN